MEPKEGDVYMNEYRFSVYVTRDGEGWTAVCPDFQDCRADGPSWEEALVGLREVLRTFVEDGLGDDELPPCRHGRNADLLAAGPASGPWIMSSGRSMTSISAEAPMSSI